MSIRDLFRLGSRKPDATPNSGKGDLDNGILNALGKIADEQYGEYAEIRRKAVELAQVMTSKRRAPRMPDGSLLDYTVEFRRIEIRHVSIERPKFPSGTCREYTFIYLCDDGDISISYADGDDLHELLIRPSIAPVYSNGMCGQGSFPDYSIEALLDRALLAA